VPAAGRRTEGGRRPTLAHRIEFLIYRTLVGLVRLLPERMALRIGEGVGWLVGVVLRIRWRTVMEHLRTAFPEKDDAWCRATARASFRHLGRESVATFRLARMEKAAIRSRTEIVGLEVLNGAWEEGKGVMVVTGHFGNWEIGAASVAARGLPIDVVVQRQRNPLFDAELTANRNRLGLQVIERKEAPRRVLRSLRGGRIVGVVGDQNIRRGGVFVDFFGRPAATARGTALLAIRAGAPVILGMAKREKGFPQRYQVTFERVDLTPSGDLEQDVIRLTEAHTRHLEARVREFPAQYFWQHRRWKTRPPADGDPEIR